MHHPISIPGVSRFLPYPRLHPFAQVGFSATPCWMYRSFTGEAFILLQDNPYDDEAVKQLLWKCYVAPWEQRKVIDPDNPIFQPKPKKIRKPRKYSEESIQRMLKRKGKDGKPKWRDPEEEERKRQHKAMNAACYERTMKKQEQLRAASFEPRASVLIEHVWEKEDKAGTALLVRRAKSPGIGLRGLLPCIALLRIAGGKRRRVRKSRRSGYFIAEAALLYPIFSG